MRRSRGYGSRCRSLFSKGPRERGKVGLSRILLNYTPGDRVVIEIEPSIHKGRPHRRYHGRVGIVKERRGRSYLVELKLGNEARIVTVRPEHLHPFG